MLKQLRIYNLILVESAEIEFTQGFNVLSGETGSGKSAIMNAISLISGERAETNMIRKGAEKAIIEAAFDKNDTAAIKALLEQSGIDFDDDEDLYIRREISLSGKNRVFINNQLAQLSLLRVVCGKLMNIVGQHANQNLLSLDQHRSMLDLFGGLKEKVADFSLAWQEELTLQNELEYLVNHEAQRLREIEACQMIEEELSDACLKEGEDDELFKEYALLAHVEEIDLKVRDILEALSGEKSTLVHLKQQKNTLDSLVAIDPGLMQISESFFNAVLEIQEVAHQLNIYQSRLEHNPGRLTEINDRLALITRLKKKYGPTVKEIQHFASENKRKLQEMQNADIKIEQLSQQLKVLRDKNHQLAGQLTLLRKAAAQELMESLSKELCSLNMPQVDFQIDVMPCKRGHQGDDRIEFFLLPNIGEHRIAIKECASGGELSRIMLSLQTLLSNLDGIPSLVFDEIDANIGGETANVVGHKLKLLGKSQQVIAITHFPQVAKHADHHIQIYKKIIDDRTITFINVLDENTRQKEIARMKGS